MRRNHTSDFEDQKRQTLLTNAFLSDTRPDTSIVGKPRSPERKQHAGKIFGQTPCNKTKDKHINQYRLMFSTIEIELITYNSTGKWTSSQTARLIEEANKTFQHEKDKQAFKQWLVELENSAVRQGTMNVDYGKIYQQLRQSLETLLDELPQSEFSQWLSGAILNSSLGETEQENFTKLALTTFMAQSTAARIKDPLHSAKRAIEPLDKIIAKQLLTHRVKLAAFAPPRNNRRKKQDKATNEKNLRGLLNEMEELIKLNYKEAITFERLNKKLDGCAPFFKKLAPQRACRPHQIKFLLQMIKLGRQQIGSMVIDRQDGDNVDDCLHYTQQLAAALAIIGNQIDKEDNKFDSKVSGIIQYLTEKYSLDRNGNIEIGLTKLEELIKYGDSATRMAAQTADIDTNSLYATAAQYSPESLKV